MQRAISVVITLAIAVVGLGLSNTAAASNILYDQFATTSLIFGTGNDNGSFTVHRENGVELGLRAKLRHNAQGDPENTFNSNGDGTYSFDAGLAPNPNDNGSTFLAGTAVWSFEWSINSNFDGSGVNLAGLTYKLGIDGDASAGQDFSLIFDPINQTYADHAIGTNATGNGGGSVAADATEYATLIGGNNVAQNSWKAHWFVPGFDPTIDGTYSFYLAAFDLSGNEVARTEMDVIVGAGGAPVPEPASIVLLGVGLAGVAAARRKKVAAAA